MLSIQNTWPEVIKIQKCLTVFLRNVASKGLSELANTCVMIPSKLPFHFAFLLVFHLYAVLNVSMELCDLLQV